MGKILPSHTHKACALMDLARIGILCCTASFVPLMVTAQSNLLMDINGTEEENYNEFSNLRSTGDRYFYVSEGRYLWTASPETDSNDPAVKLATFNSIDNLVVAGSTVFFSADDGAHGTELWKSDGTAGGTVMVKDIRPGAGSAQPTGFAISNGIVYFAANNGTQGNELWRSNGTAGGTVMVKDILPKVGGSNPRHLADVNGVVFFSANDGTHGYELWKTDGTAGGTMLVKDIWTGTRLSSGPERLVNANGVLYFTAQDATTGRELYRSDGTQAGTMLVKDLRPGTASAGIENLTSMDGTVYFSANDGISGFELWKSNGTAGGTVLVRDITPGPAGSHGENAATPFRMANFTAINGLLYFTAYQNNDYYAWKSDGTAAGTTPLFIASGPGRGQPRPAFTEMNGAIFFFNRDDPSTEEDYSFFRMNPDGSSRLSMMFLYNNIPDPYYPEIVVAFDGSGSSYLYFYGRPLWTGVKLNKSDGMIGGNTDALWHSDPFIASQGSNPHNFIPFGNRIAFIAQSTFYESHSIFITDGSTAGTRELINFQHMSNGITTTNTHIYGSGRDWLEIYKTDGVTQYTDYLVSTYEESPAKDLTGAGQHVYYTRESRALWKIDGVTDAFTQLRTFNHITDLKPLNGNLIFRERTLGNGEELWRSNGTLSGTYRYKVMRTAPAAAPLYSPSVTIRNTHYFIANDGVHGNEVWRTQGSGASTYMLGDLNTNDAATVVGGAENDIRSLGAFRDSLYISAIGNDGQWSLFKSKGTTSGIQKVSDMNAVMHMAAAGNKLFLFAHGPDNKTGLYLWVTNGAASGTRQIAELPMTSSIYHYAIDGVLYFNLDNSLWRSDGTECGTFMIDAGASEPMFLAGVGNRLLFSGFNQSVGREPYVINTPELPGSPCAAAVAASQGAQPQSLFSSYPNPFSNDFAVSLRGNENEPIQVVVTTIAGFPVEELRGAEALRDRRLGESWAPGMYVIKVTRGDKTETRIVVKK